MQIYAIHQNQIIARDYGSVLRIVATDFEALYAYKRGDYQRCLQLSTQNVHTLVYVYRAPSISTLPEFVQLLDDEIVSLIALTVIVNPECRFYVSSSITQLTLSLYLMTQCQLKLRHSVTTLVKTLHYIEVAQIKHDVSLTVNHLVLKFIERSALAYIKASAAWQ